MKKLIALLCAAALLLSCAAAEELTPDRKPATAITAAENASVYQLLDFSDTTEMDFATRGLIYAPEDLVITQEDGSVVWSQAAYDFLDKESPDTADPSLWRHTQMNHVCGLFEVMEGIYQVRGYDMTNITFIKGETGWIVFDPLMSVECAAAAKALVDEHLGVFPVKAIVISHSHVDHFGGIEGIVTEEEVKAQNIPIIAPEGFEHHAVSENIYAGSAMNRRASYQYGALLEPGEQGRLAIGIGMGQSLGVMSYLSPTDSITESGEVRVIDGVTMEFQLTPGTEAPAEMNTWFPDFNALWLAENCTGTLHNLYTLRGAQVRDGNAWAYYIMEALELYGGKADVVFQSHNWPHWGNEVIRDYMVDTAAVYKFIHDQTLFYINLGYTDTEIVDLIKLPDDLEKVWYTRQYYGTLIHNVKAVYQKYMGWYDANPIHLNELAPAEYATKLVEYLGDTNRVLDMAKADYAKGEYQWVAEITNALVYADPANLDARYLCADALEQLGYQAESGPWRNAYLTAAQELRTPGTTFAAKTLGKQALLSHMSTDLMLEYFGICLDSESAQDMNITVDLLITDTNEHYLLTFRSGILLYQATTGDPTSTNIWRMPKAGLFAMMQKDTEAMETLIQVEGDRALLDNFCQQMMVFTPQFNIAEP